MAAGCNRKTWECMYVCLCCQAAAAASQLIANDALSYYMVLSDNENFDSINNPLVKFIKADLFFSI
jgi:hypothetical protein